MAPPLTWNPREAILYRQMGLSWSNVAEKLGKSSTAIYTFFQRRPALCKKEGISLRQPQWDRERARQLKADGWTYLEIGEEVGARPGTMKQWFYRERRKAFEEAVDIGKAVK